MSTGRDTRSEALRPLRDLILLGNMMALKIGDDPNNLANTWDELVERLRGSGILERFALLQVMAGNAPECGKKNNGFPCSLPKGSSCPDCGKTAKKAEEPIS